MANRAENPDFAKVAKSRIPTQAEKQAKMTAVHRIASARPMLVPYTARQTAWRMHRWCSITHEQQRVEEDFRKRNGLFRRDLCRGSRTFKKSRYKLSESR
jgi:hypothetical protein